MTAYMRVVDGRIELVFARDDATRLEDEDAKHLLVLATETWHNLVWKLRKSANRNTSLRPNGDKSSTAHRVNDGPGTCARL